MPLLVLPDPKLFNQSQAGAILGLSRQAVGEIAPKLGLAWKRDPTRRGLMLDRADLDRIARALKSPIDWGALGLGR